MNLKTGRPSLGFHATGEEKGRSRPSDCCYQRIAECQVLRYGCQSHGDGTRKYPTFPCRNRDELILTEVATEDKSFRSYTYPQDSVTSAWGSSLRINVRARSVKSPLFLELAVTKPVLPGPARPSLELSRMVGQARTVWLFEPPVRGKCRRLVESG